MLSSGIGSFAVVVPTYNNAHELIECLGAIKRQTDARFSVFVCVDGSRDGTLERLRASEWSFPVTVLEHADGQNHGRSAARNLALRNLDAEFVLFLDSDMRLEPDALARHRELLAIRDCVSIGSVVYLNAQANLWARYLATRGRGKVSAGGDVRPLDFVTANSAFRSAHFLAVNGFDETLVGYGGEDTELALRLWRDRGTPFVFNPAARALSIEAKTVEQGLDELRRYAGTNLRTIRHRYPDLPAPFWIDRLSSRRWRDRLLRMLLNPLTDGIVAILLPISPFGIQRRLLDYRVIRTVFEGYVQGIR